MFKFQNIISKHKSTATGITNLCADPCSVCAMHETQRLIFDSRTLVAKHLLQSHRSGQDLSNTQQDSFVQHLLLV